jgi:hypothetical protein
MNARALFRRWGWRILWMFAHRMMFLIVTEEAHDSTGR